MDLRFKGKKNVLQGLFYFWGDVTRSLRLLSFQTEKRSFPVLVFQVCQMEPRGAEIAKGMPGELEVKLNRLADLQKSPCGIMEWGFLSAFQLGNSTFFFFKFLDLLF